SANHGEGFGVGHCQVVSSGGHQASDRVKRLGNAKDEFTAFGIWKEFRKPGYGGDKFHGDANQGRAPKDQQLGEGSRETSSASRQAIEHDAPDENALSAKKIRKVAPEEPENSRRDIRKIEQQSHPQIEG